MTKKKDEAPKDSAPLTPEQVAAEAAAARHHSEHGKAPK